MTLRTPTDRLLLSKIISGGQTGVDRGALDAALQLNFPAGGWCPADRRAEDGRIPARYPVSPLRGAGYPERTRRNVFDHDATLLVFDARLTAGGGLVGGTWTTYNYCRKYGKPYWVINAGSTSVHEATDQVLRFLARCSVRTLNVAGPRRSGWSGGHDYTKSTLLEVIQRVVA
jgi:hypothetical protein